MSPQNPSPNPIAYAFGLALRTIRTDVLGHKTEKELITSPSDTISHSFYRLVEFGRSNLSSSKVRAVFEVFEGRISLEALYLIVSVISDLDSNSRGSPRGSILHESTAWLQTAAEPDGSLSKLLQCFLRPIEGTKTIFQLSDTLEPAELKSRIVSAGLHKEILDFLTGYRTYGLDLLQSVRSYERDYFSDISSINKWLFDKIKDGVKRTPKTVSRDSSIAWEREHTSAFKSYLVVVRLEHLTKAENLATFDYSFVAAPNLEYCLFAFTDVSPSGQHHAGMRFLAQLERSNKKAFNAVADCLSKFQFHGIQDNLREMEDILSDSKNNRYNSMCLIEMSDHYLVGMFAITNESNGLADVLTYMTFGEAEKAYAKLTNDILSN